MMRKRPINAVAIDGALPQFERVCPRRTRHPEGTGENLALPGSHFLSYVIAGGVSQLELVLVSQLVSSLPVFEYELGSLAASSLVTPSCPFFHGRDCVVPV
jgi:hypothetical protein